MICNNCDFHKTAKNVYITGRGPLDPDFVVIGRAPGIQENEMGAVFVDDAGKKLEELLVKSKIHPDRVRFENVCRCYPGKDPGGGDVTPAAVHIKACFPYFLDLLKEIKGTPVIIPLGNVPLKAFTGMTGIMKHYANVIDWIHPETRQVYDVVPSPHPAAVLRPGSTVREDHILQSLDKAKKVHEGWEEEQEDYAALLTLDDVEEYLTFVWEGHHRGELPYIAIDLETMDGDRQDSLQWFRDGAIVSGIGISHKPYFGRVIPLDTAWHTFSGDLDRGVILGLLESLVGHVPIINHNLKYDLKWMKRVLDIHPKKILGDTMLQAWSLFNRSQAKNLDSLASRHTTMRQPKKEMKDAKKKQPKGQRAMYFVSQEIYTNYVCRDVDAVMRLYKKFGSEIAKLPPLLLGYKQLMIKSIPIFTDIELAGVKMDTGMLAVLKVNLEKELYNIGIKLRQDPWVKEAWARYQVSKVHKVVKKHNIWCEEINAKAAILPMCNNVEEQRLQTWAILAVLNTQPLPAEDVQKYVTRTMKAICKQCEKLAADKDFGFGSIPALRELFYSVYGFNAGEHKTKKGEPSTDKDALDAMLSGVKRKLSENGINDAMRAYLNSAQFVLSGILEIRNKGKILTSYVSSLPKNISSDSHLYESFKIRATDTGRFASAFHTIPKESEVQKVFISRFDDGLILQIDESQAEVRVAACLSNDQNLIAILLDEQDLHRQIAALLYGKAPGDITDEERQHSKTIVFGILYGRGSQAIADAEGMSLQEADGLIKSFWYRFSGFAAWAEQEKVRVRETEASWSPLGHRRLISEVRSVDRKVRAKADRRIVNSPIQSTASDLTLLAIHKLYNHIGKYNLQSKIFGYVHDSILVDCPVPELFNVAQHANYFMTDALRKDYPWITVPLKADCEIGATWGNLMGLSWNSPNAFTLQGGMENWRLIKRRLLSGGSLQLIRSTVDGDNVSVTLDIKK